MLRVAASLALAAAGGGIALAGAGLTGNLGGGTTVEEVVQAPVAPARLAAAAPRRLTDEEIYRRDAPGVVRVNAAGSGFVIDKAGHIVTNEQVVGRGETARVSFSGRAEMVAAVVGKDPSTGVALLEVNARSRSLTPLPLGNSDLVQVGDPVLAIGHPLGLTRTATAGIVSAVGRTIDAPSAIAVDAAIAPASAGGPLIDGDGDVIGMVGSGSAVPINTVKAVVAQLIRDGRAQHVVLGVGAQPVTPTVARLFDLPASHGLLVQSVRPGSGAAAAGLRAGSRPVVVGGESYLLGGDLIVAVDGRPVATPEQLRDLIETRRPGDRLRLAVYRGGARRTVEVTLGRPPG